MRDHHHHLTDQELLQALDHELPSRRQARAETHLLQCVSCRSRRSEIARLAASVTAFYQDDPAPQGGNAAHARERLRWQLNQVADTWDAFSPVRLITSLVLTPRWMTIGAAVAAVVLLIRFAPPSPAPDARRTGAPVERDALPVAALTPGATSNVSLGDLCAGGTNDEPPPAAVRQKVLRDYGMEDVPFDQYELDYLITPELGGAPDPRNLWPQRYTSRVWNAHVKDQLEGLLPRLVCDRQVALQTAQRDIALDWIAAYKKYFKTDAPLHAQASLSFDDDASDAENVPYPARRSAGAASAAARPASGGEANRKVLVWHRRRPGGRDRDGSTGGRAHFFFGGRSSDLPQVGGAQFLARPARARELMRHAGV